MRCKEWEIRGDSERQKWRGCQVRSRGKWNLCSPGTAVCSKCFTSSISALFQQILKSSIGLSPVYSQILPSAPCMGNFRNIFPGLEYEPPLYRQRTLKMREQGLPYSVSGLPIQLTSYRPWASDFVVLKSVPSSNTTQSNSCPVNFL